MPPPAKTEKSVFRCRLLVEGGADYNFFGHLFVKRGLYEKPQEKIIPKGFETKASGDWVGVLNGLTQLKDQDIDTLGIILDADLDLQERWNDIAKKLKEFELKYSLPNQPDPKGTIIEGKTEPRIKRLGIWLMPDNQLTGILEHFIAKMIKPEPENKKLWDFVESTLNKLPDGPRFNPDKDLAKAQVATWLAWQEEPGHPIGLAVTKGYVDAHSESVDDFIDWIKNLFQLENTISIKPE